MSYAELLNRKVSQLIWTARGRVGHDPTFAPVEELLRCELDKGGVVLGLARHFGLSRYLELVSTTSGNFYRQLHKSGELKTRRLMYSCKWNQTDGLPIDWRSPTDDIAVPLSQLRRDGFEPQICLVDPWHLYATSRRDIEAAFALLPDGGVMVVHDCLPPDAAMAGPQPQPGCWCGWTYRAFLDFVWSRPGLQHFTVDCDFGCGVIVKGEGRVPDGLIPQLDPQEREAIAAGWLALGDNSEAAFDYLQRNKVPLLNLISAQDFGAVFG